MQATNTVLVGFCVAVVVWLSTYCGTVWHYERKARRND